MIQVAPGNIPTEQLQVVHLKLKPCSQILMSASWSVTLYTKGVQVDGNQ